MSIHKGILETKTGNNTSDILYPKTSIDQVVGLPVPTSADSGKYLGVDSSGNFALISGSTPPTPSEPSYITFSSRGMLMILTSESSPTWDGILYYSTDAVTWEEWDGSLIISDGGDTNSIYFRGVGNTTITSGYNRWQTYTSEEILCSGNIENLLDYQTVLAGNHPVMAAYCFSYLFAGFYKLATAPSLPAIILTDSCYKAMFNNCKSLTTLPELPATTLTQHCYDNMFNGCNNIKISTTQTGEYQNAYRIPATGTGTTALAALDDMFTFTGGTFTGTPSINTTYYTSNTVV